MKTLILGLFMVSTLFTGFTTKENKIDKLSIETSVTAETSTVIEFTIDEFRTHSTINSKFVAEILAEAANQGRSMSCLELANWVYDYMYWTGSGDPITAYETANEVYIQCSGN